ncbi:peptidylprolyl isomerase [Cellulosilyticum ruminicola]|uniref:peptidylprolyl isomerase n=1 Tax=Cellulosilyticum ruminicola TaxID=425254 RepID=UPI0009F896EC|nr:peptidylprolyl isomerase [Cellulosilyticum ruminicola]
MRLINSFTKNWLNFSITFTVLTISCFANPNQTQIKLNNKLLSTPVAPIQENGTTLVPLRVISENLGATVNFNSRNKEITITKSSQKIVLTLGKTAALVNNTKQILTKAPTTLNNTTMVPLRFVSEQLNCTVNWDNATKLISITSKNATDASQKTELPVATLKIKDYGIVTLELYPEMAPNTVNNFIALANSGFYDGLTFHRIISDFMIQGGDPEGTGMGGPGYSIAGEFEINGFTQNTLSHEVGVISMARNYMPNSAGSQFFIVSGEATYLDGQYAAFGKVTSGLDIINKVQNVPTGPSDKPKTPVVIETLRVNTQGITYPAPTKVEK